MLLHKQKREKKEFKKRRHPRVYIESYNVKHTRQFGYRKKIDEIIIGRYKNELFDFFKQSGFIGEVSRKVAIDKSFSIEKEPDSALRQIAIIHTSVSELGEQIELDFSDCSFVDLHTLFVLRVIVNEYRKKQYDLQKRVYSKNVISQVSIVQSKNNDVNKKLLAAGIVSSITTTVEQMMPISIMGMYVGDKSQELYSENKKGTTATKIVRYINDDCLKKYDFELTFEDRRNMAGLIAEVLNNSEDHSMQKKWYATGAFFEDNRLLNNPSKEIVGELTLTILNFGGSFYDGFYETRLENAEVFNELNQMHDVVRKKPRGDIFTKENYFTLFALQDGISRLKFERESRGTGTMKFINSFLEIGDYEDKDRGYCPLLSILSGSTLLQCDNKYRSFQLNGEYYLSLNPENDLSIPPKETHLKPLNVKFPGTVLAIKIYLNKNHLASKYQNNGNGRKGI
jgi:hypothetical protein